MSLFKSAFTVGSFTLLSRILGYTRDILIASAIGTSFLADAFFVAFRLPNIFRQLSAEGAFNNAFVPLFTGKLAADGKEAAIGFAGHVCSFMLFVLLIFTVLMQISMPYVMHVLAPGFVGEADKFAVTVVLARIMFPYLVFISLVSLYSGMLNSLGKFAAASFTPVLLNICLIIAILLFAEVGETPAHSLAWGVMVAGVAQLVWLIFSAHKNGIRIKLSRPKHDRDVRTLLRKMLPGIVGGGVTQINLWINTVIATMLPSAVSYLYYADRLVQFPLGIIGTAMGTAILPLLSRHIKENNQGEAIRAQNKGLEIALLLTVPAAFGLAFTAYPLISLMFERGQFTSSDTLFTAQALMAYSFGLPAFVMIKIFAPGFFAAGDTKTPVKIAIACMLVNVSLSLLLIGHIGHIGLAISTSVSAWLNTTLLCFLLMKKGMFRFRAGLKIKLLKILMAAVSMAVSLYYMQLAFPAYFSGSFAIKMASVIFLIVLGGIIFFAMLLASRCYLISDLKKLSK